MVTFVEDMFGIVWEQVDGGIVMVHVHAHEKEGTRNTKPSGCKHSRDVEGSTHAVLLPPKSLGRNSWPAVIIATSASAE